MDDSSLAPRTSSGDEPSPRVLSVAELTAEIKQVVEGSFPSVWVAGEISNLSRPRSGHCYLTLKDDEAVLGAVIWRQTAARVPFELRAGLEVVCHGNIDVYPPHGKYQLVIRQIEPRGIGALELAFRQLQQKLAAEGLFDPDIKKPLPPFPRSIALVTSPTGAAVHDFLQVVRRRWPAARVLVVPVRVQGEGSAEEIAQAIRMVNSLAEPVDTLVVARGGGSLEDLWAFNEEVVVRAIHGSRIPVVSGVGHEVDVTLADLAADVRALTPTEAAERVVPAAADVATVLRGFGQRMLAGLTGRTTAARAALDALSARRVLRDPYERIHDRQRRLDDLSARVARAAQHRLTLARGHLATLSAGLDSLSPLAVLRRGYSLTQRLSDGATVRNASDLAVGDSIATRFATGRAVSRIEEIET